MASDNRSLLRNSIILYIRLGIVTICSFFSTRFALEALGVVDFGLFAVVGSIITLISIMNTMMVSTSNRFIATEIGKGNIEQVNKQFNVNLFVHFVIACLTFLLAFSLGDWYILHYIKYEGNIDNVVFIFNITVAAAVFSFMGVPYNGLLMAKEKFIVFCSTDVASYLIKVIVSWLLIYHFEDKLMTYAWMMVLITAYPPIVFAIYCSLKYPNIVKFKLVKDVRSYFNVMKFTLWVGYGTIVQVGKSQAAAILVNGFFSTLMNTALGLANSLKNLVDTFAVNVTKSIEPQITKTYASGDVTRCASLMVLSSKVSFMLNYIVSIPLFLETEFIVHLWLGRVPEYVVPFTRIMLVTCLIDSLSSGISDYVFATGKIRAYQFWVNTILLLSVPASFFVLKSGAPPQAILYVYLLAAVVVFFAKQVILHKSLGFDNKILIIRAYLPDCFVLLLTMPIFVVRSLVDISAMLCFIMEMCYCIACTVFVGLSKRERQILVNVIRRQQ